MAAGDSGRVCPGRARSRGGRGCRTATACPRLPFRSAVRPAWTRAPAPANSPCPGNRQDFTALWKTAPFDIQNEDGEWLPEILAEFAQVVRGPVVAGLPHGHCLPAVTIPVGRPARLDARPGTGELTLSW